MRPHRILVVDDEPDLELLISQRFRKRIRANELDFIFAANGAEALEKLNNDGLTEVVLTDINMPVMDGLTLLRLHRENPAVEQIPIVMVTTEGDSSVGEVATKYGASGFVTKPIDGRVLRAMALELIAKSRAGE